jgi:hypothetical protein
MTAFIFLRLSGRGLLDLKAHVSVLLLQGSLENREKEVSSKAVEFVGNAQRCPRTCGQPGRVVHQVRQNPQL